MREIVKIRLGGAEHGMRPTWEAYGEIEARCGPLWSLWQKVNFHTATLQELAVIVTAGMKAAGSSDGRRIDENAVSKRLFEEGVFSEEVAHSVSDFLEALGWTPEQRKKLKAELEKMEGNPSLAASATSSLSPQPSTD